MNVYLSMLTLTLPPLGGVFYLPVLTSLVATLSCTYETRAGTMVLYNGPPIPCWEGTHIVYAVIGAIGIFMYYPFAVRFQPLWQVGNPLA